jgi:hypothetical protein
MRRRAIIGNAKHLRGGAKLHKAVNTMWKTLCTSGESQ